MLIEVKVPTLSESVAEATLLAWNKKQGESVSRDENLIDIETDKVVLELPAPESGVLAKIIKSEGDTVVAEEIIAHIDTSVQPGKKEKQTNDKQNDSREIVETEKKNDEVAIVSGGASVMPSAKKIAAESNLPLQDVKGTGRGGRVTKSDVLNHINDGKVDQQRSNSDKSPGSGEIMGSNIEDRTEERVPMSRLRQRVAERLVESQGTAAILSTFNEVNMDPVIALRKKYKEKFEMEHGIKLGFMSFFVKAVVHALKKYPIVNASVDGTDIVYHGFFDIGIAVGSPRGLVVPILRNADQLSFADVEKSINDFGQRAQAGKLTIEELTGGTFSISNGGVFGSMLSTPIINPPQSAILGIHATKDRPVVENGEVVIRPMNYLALSYDHRIIDGREAVLFLVAIKDSLEDPSRLLLEI
ncbi:MAG: dihydrolipoyllysine-residue succinyltransferase [Proteobacteria bacterium]|nr:dihydrolipoyllysine-residue succinyltransferase [Pseudomonadota bacterium]